MSDELERTRRRQAKLKILVGSMLVAAGAMFVWLGIEIAKMF
jgi:hypothetical protein